ncbi:MAG: hypothetical protein ACI9OO_001073 [Bacteroidia bacterium]|jgi:hypothetical protein
MAGLWEQWSGGEDQRNGFTVITTTSAQQVEWVHNRMPLMVLLMISIAGSGARQRMHKPSYTTVFVRCPAILIGRQSPIINRHPSHPQKVLSG